MKLGERLGKITSQVTFVVMVTNIKCDGHSLVTLRQPRLYKVIKYAISVI